jgi:hypothetical protein
MQSYRIALGPQQGRKVFTLQTLPASDVDDPNSKNRALVTPARRGKGNKVKAPDELEDQTPAERRAAMSWAQRLMRVFNIDIETCSECGGAVKIIACIEDPVVIDKILIHLHEKVTSAGTGLLPEVRAPPQVGLFD